LAVASRFLVPDVQAEVLRQHGVHGPVEVLDRRTVGDLADVHGHNLAADGLDALDDLGLGAELSEEPVEVAGDVDLSATCLDGGDRLAESWALVQGLAAGHVQLLVDLDRRQPLALARGLDALALDLPGRRRTHPRTCRSG